MSESEVYTVEAATLTGRLARGWHCLGLADQYRDGKPHKLEAFGTQIVVFETESGQLAALNNFCPHMGASLADGRVRGESLACPFHDWRWGADGRCTAIPYARRIPGRARTRGWKLQELNDVLYIWHDPEGKDPDLTLRPVVDYETSFSPWIESVHRIKTNTRELVDNLVDVAHFFYVHGQGVGKAAGFFANWMEGQEAWQFIEGTDPSAEDYDKQQPGVPVSAIGTRRTETCYNGPAYLLSRLLRKTEDDEIEAYIILGQLPISENEFDLRMLTCARNRPELSAEENAERSKKIGDAMRAGTMEDVQIWRTKTRIDNPLLCDGDGPVYQLRRWYEQFFVDRADIRPEMTARFEQVVDLSHASKAWERQAAENRAERGVGNIPIHGGIA